MASYLSGSATIHMDQHEPSTLGEHPALLVLHGSGGAASYWLERFTPALLKAGVALYAPHYFDKTGIQRATTETILDGRSFIAWLKAVQDAITYVASRPGIDASRIGVVGISLGGFLAVAAGIEDRRLRAVVELSGGVPLGWEDRMRPGMPPTLVLHGARDTVVPVLEAHKLEALLKAHHIRHETHIFAEETHWFSPPAQFQLLLHAAEFLGKYLQFEGKDESDREDSDAA